MSFFESIPQPPPPPAGRPRRPVWSRPDAVIPGSLSADLMLIRTEQAAVAVTTECAYPNGFEFTVHVHARHPEKFPPDPLGREGPGPRPDEPVLRLGVVYADGRRIATTARHPRRSDDLAGLVLIARAGGGDEHSWRTGFWLYPLPPEGPVTLVVFLAGAGHTRSARRTGRYGDPGGRPAGGGPVARRARTGVQRGLAEFDDHRRGI